MRAAATAAGLGLAAWAGTATATAPARPPSYHVRYVSAQRLPFLYNQGIAALPDGGWILSGTDSPLPATDVLVRTDAALHVVVRNVAAIPPAWRAKGYDHIGDLSVVGNVIYAPYEQPNYTLGHQAVARYDARTLRFLSALELPQHENSFLAVDPVTMTAYTMDHFDGAALLRYDIRHGWRRLPPLRLTSLLHHTQGAAVSAGAVWISTSDPDDHLYRVDIRTGATQLVGRLPVAGGEGEGIEVAPRASGDLHVLEIAPNQQSVLLEHFRVVRTR